MPTQPHYIVFNYMIQIQVILLIFLASVTTHTFIIQAGNVELRPAQVDVLGDRKDDNDTSRFMRGMFLFPYQIKQFRLFGTNSTKQNGYFFQKAPFEDVEYLFDQNTTSYSQNQQQVLYSLLPDIILVKSNKQERIKLSLLEQTLTNNAFIIQNQTLDKQSSMQIFLFQIEIQKFMFKMIQKAQYILARNSSLNKKFTELFNSTDLKNSNNQLYAELNQPDPAKQLILKKRMQFLFSQILPNQTIIQSFSNIESLMKMFYSQKINPSTKWQAHLFKFNIKFFSASILPPQRPYQQKRLELVSLTWKGGKIAHNTTVVQPLSYLPLKTIDQASLCCQRGLVDTLFLSDGQKMYLFDITYRTWQLKRFRLNTTSRFKQMFFGKQCSLLNLQISTRVSQFVNEDNVTEANITANNTFLYTFYPMKRLMRLMSTTEIMSSFKQLGNQLGLLCWQTYCSVIKYEPYTLIIKIPFFQGNFSAKVGTSIQNMTIVTYIAITDENYTVTTYELSAQTITQNIFYTVIPQIMYPVENYFNQTKFSTKQINRIVLEQFNIDVPNVVNINNSAQVFSEIFLNEAEGKQEQRCLRKEHPSSSKISYSFDNDKSWSACSFDFRVESISQLKFIFKEQKTFGYFLYLCQAELQQIQNSNVECISIAAKDQYNNNQVNYHLERQNYYKVIAIRDHKIPLFQGQPEIYLRDIQKQELEIASAVFFFILLTICLLVLSGALFALARNALITCLTYYGYIEQRGDPAYPLSWFSLKTKLKRLTQMRVLRYIRYETAPTQTDEGNQCCFCIQNLQVNSIVAHLYCGHEFHKECFNEWVRNEPNTRCPTCRRGFSKAAVEQFEQDFGSSQQLPLG